MEAPSIQTSDQGTELIDIEQPRAGSRWLHQAAHHLPGEIGKQDLTLIDRVEHGALAERGGENLSLRLQRLDLPVNEIWISV